MLPSHDSKASPLTLSHLTLSNILIHFNLYFMNLVTFLNLLHGAHMCTFRNSGIEYS